MPPGGDNICEKSSQFHFVNEYLYKPVNLEEYQQKPNVSLRYSERFYPQNYYEDNNENEQNEENQAPVAHRNSVRWFNGCKRWDELIVFRCEWRKMCQSKWPERHSGRRLLLVKCSGLQMK